MMGWLRLDDAFDDHPKIIGLSDRAFRAHVTGLLYCARHLTDGFIPRPLGPRAAVVRELEHAGLWTSTKRGWQVHDYLEYNPSKADAIAKRDSKAMAGAKGAASRWHRPGNAPVPSPTPTPKTLAADKPPRKRDELFESLAEVDGTDIGQLTRSARGRLNDATKQLREVGATAEDVRARAATYRRVHPEWPLTAQALVKHWPSLNGAIATPANITSSGLDDAWLWPDPTDQEDFA